MLSPHPCLHLSHWIPMPAQSLINFCPPRMLPSRIHRNPSTHYCFCLLSWIFAMSTYLPPPPILRMCSSIPHLIMWIVFSHLCFCPNCKTNSLNLSDCTCSVILWLRTSTMSILVSPSPTLHLLSTLNWHRFRKIILSYFLFNC